MEELEYRTVPLGNGAGNWDTHWTRNTGMVQRAAMQGSMGAWVPIQETHHSMPHVHLALSGNEALAGTKPKSQDIVRMCAYKPRAVCEHLHVCA